MMKYTIAVLIFVVSLAAVLFYIGDDITLTLNSSAQSGALAFSPLQLTWQIVILMGTALTVGVILIWSCLSWLWRLPRRVKSGVGLWRRDKALGAMEDALTAGAQGDISKSRKHAERARSLIRSDDLGRIISAQTAEASGDREEALVQYTSMLGSEKTRAVGQRGLAQNMLEVGNLPAAIEQAQAAYAENKHARWAFDILFKAQAADFQWSAALETLSQGESRKHISKENARRRRAVLQTAEADSLHDIGQTDASLDLASKAAQSAPDFSPATALAAKQYVATGLHKKAASLIEKAWSQAPHPALSLAFLDIYANENAKTRTKRIQSLIKHNPEHRESVLLLVEDALRDGDGVKALSLLTPLLEEKPTARLCVLAAQTETILQNPADASLWMQRAAIAPREADWSDLDPAGDSFDYSAQDWRRLVFSFGDTGELIHPRAERQDAAKLPFTLKTLPISAQSKDSDTVQNSVQKTSVNTPKDVIAKDTQTPIGHDPQMRRPDDPGVPEIKGPKKKGGDDLAGRLDSLLD